MLGSLIGKGEKEEQTKTFPAPSGRCQGVTEGGVLPGSLLHTPTIDAIDRDLVKLNLVHTSQNDGTLTVSSVLFRAWMVPGLMGKAGSVRVVSQGDENRKALIRHPLDGASVTDLAVSPTFPLGVLPDMPLESEVLASGDSMGCVVVTGVVVRNEDGNLETKEVARFTFPGTPGTKTRVHWHPTKPGALFVLRGPHLWQVGVKDDNAFMGTQLPNLEAGIAAPMEVVTTPPSFQFNASPTSLVASDVGGVTLVVVACDEGEGGEGYPIRVCTESGGVIAPLNPPYVPMTHPTSLRQLSILRSKTPYLTCGILAVGEWGVAAGGGDTLLVSTMELNVENSGFSLSPWAPLVFQPTGGATALPPLAFNTTPALPLGDSVGGSLVGVMVGPKAPDSPTSPNSSTSTPGGGGPLSATLLLHLTTSPSGLWSWGGGINIGGPRTASISLALTPLFSMDSGASGVTRGAKGEEGTAMLLRKYSQVELQCFTLKGVHALRVDLADALTPPAAPAGAAGGGGGGSSSGSGSGSGAVSAASAAAAALAQQKQRAEAQEDEEAMLVVEAPSPIVRGMTEAVSSSPPKSSSPLAASSATTSSAPMLPTPSAASLPAFPLNPPSPPQAAALLMPFPIASASGGASGSSDSKPLPPSPTTGGVTRKVITVPSPSRPSIPLLNPTSDSVAASATPPPPPPSSAASAAVPAMSSPTGSFPPSPTLIAESTLTSLMAEQIKALTQRLASEAAARDDATSVEIRGLLLGISGTIQSQTASVLAGMAAAMDAGLSALPEAIVGAVCEEAGQGGGGSLGAALETSLIPTFKAAAVEAFTAAFKDTAIPAFERAAGVMVKDIAGAVGVEVSAAATKTTSACEASVKALTATCTEQASSVKKALDSFSSTSAHALAGLSKAASECVAATAAASTAATAAAAAASAVASATPAPSVRHPEDVAAISTLTSLVESLRGEVAKLSVLLQQQQQHQQLQLQQQQQAQDAVLKQQQQQQQMNYQANLFQQAQQAAALQQQQLQKQQLMQQQQQQAAEVYAAQQQLLQAKAAVAAAAAAAATPPPSAPSPPLAMGISEMLSRAVASSASGSKAAGAGGGGGGAGGGAGGSLASLLNPPSSPPPSSSSSSAAPIPHHPMPLPTPPNPTSPGEMRLSQALSRLGDKPEEALASVLNQCSKATTLGEPLYAMRAFAAGSGSMGVALRDKVVRAALSTLTPFERLALLQRISMVVSGGEVGLEVTSEGDGAARLLFLLATLDAMTALGDHTKPDVKQNLPSVKDLVKDALLGRRGHSTNAWVMTTLGKCEARLEEAGWRQ